MVPLPDGTFLILNGAHAGVAGFGLGSDPNLIAILYDPTKPVNQRMSVMANTTIARMYHSEAILMQRLLIGPTVAHIRFKSHRVAWRISIYRSSGWYLPLMGTAMELGLCSRHFLAAEQRVRSPHHRTPISALLVGL